MCLIKVKEELDDEPPHRVVERRPSVRPRTSRTNVVETVQVPYPRSSPGSRDGGGGDGADMTREINVIQALPPPVETVRRGGGGGGVGVFQHEWEERTSSPRASVVSTRSRDYYVDRSPASGGGPPRGGFRYVNPRRSTHSVGVAAAAVAAGTWDDAERAGETEVHGHSSVRRRRSVRHVNPARQSHRSVRSRDGRISREKVIVVDRNEDEGVYYY